MSEGFAGGCLCGAVRFESNADPMITGHCHCVDCRKTSGTGHSSHMVIPKEAISITGDVRAYDRPADSGNIVTRTFCPTCGSPVYSLNNAMPDMIFIRASTLDDLEVFKPQMAVYRSRAASWDHPDPAISNFDTVPDGGPEKVIGDAMPI